MTPDVTVAVSVGITLGALCIGALRLVDVNEREPLWALALLVWLGVVAAGAAALAFEAQDSAFAAALLVEASKATAIAIGVAAIGLAGRRRGISDLNSVLDWLLYGAAAGVGFAIGDGFLRTTFSAGTELQSPDPRNTLDLAWMTVQSCLTEAAFGALFGAALGVAAQVRRRLLRVPIGTAGLAAAVCVHAGYAALVLQHGVHAPGISAAGAAAVALVLALALAGLAHALRGELRVIGEELAREDEATVRPEERALLCRPSRRYRTYVELLAKGDIERWIRDRRVHDHQVALAFAKRSHAAGEADHRRAAIAAARTGGLLPPRPGAPVLLAAVLLLLAGVVVIQQASGGEEPTTFATRTSLADREAHRLAERRSPPRALRTAVLLVPAHWRLQEGREHDALLEAGAREAYELEYASGEATVRYTLARYGSPAAARAVATRLAAAPDAEAWAQDEVVSRVRGSRDARYGFCDALGSPRACPP